MAKITTRSIYTFIDELTGERIEQDTEPTTFKIKLTGDTTTYEKVMSAENEEQFRNWLKVDGASLAAQYVGQIEELEREIEQLQKDRGQGKRTKSSTGSNAPAKDTILLKVLNDNGIDRDQVIKHIEAEKLSWGGKRFSVETLKQVVRDKNLTSEAKEAGVPAND